MLLCAVPTDLGVNTLIVFFEEGPLLFLLQTMRLTFADYRNNCLCLSIYLHIRLPKRWRDGSVGKIKVLVTKSVYLNLIPGTDSNVGRGFLQVRL